MQDTMKIGAAALGGYVLGRTKKGKAAIGLAFWLAGRKRPADMARDSAVKLLRSDRGQELLGELRGPVLTAGRQAALSVFEAQAGRLGDAMQRRSESLSGPASAGDGSARRRRDARDDENDDQYDDEYDDGTGTDDETDERDDAYEDDLDDAPGQGDSDSDEYEDEYDDEDDQEDQKDDENDGDRRDSRATTRRSRRRVPA